MKLKQSIIIELSKYILDVLDDEQFQDNEDDLYTIHTWASEGYIITHKREAEYFIENHYNNNLLSAICELMELYDDHYNHVICASDIDSLELVVNRLATVYIDKIIWGSGEKIGELKKRLLANIELDKQKN